MKLGLLLSLCSVVCGDPFWDVTVNYSSVTGVSKTTTTLQVVSNPILDREFHVNGTTIPNPIHDQAFASLANLGADLVRFVPWFPYPQVAVAELDAPAPGKPTSWDFTHILPQFMDFMAAVLGKNHSTVINFSTQPCWLFGDQSGKVQDCSYPSNPDQSFFNYVRGNRANLLDPTAGDLAAYYVRLLSWIILGEFTDEHGVVHSGGPKYDMSRSKGHVWELFNEAEHGYNVEQYIHDYDLVVSAMIKAVGADRAPAFMGIGGATPEWVSPFLNKSNHHEPPPIDYVSLHFYAGCDNRTDPNTFPEFFEFARGFVQSMIGNIQNRDKSSWPQVKFDLDELGVIMPDDNDPSFDITANLPDIYWNAAGAMYAYLYMELAPMGVEVLGHSQLAGSPKIPEWNIPEPQYPSVSLLDWRTGYGNARYWSLKLLLEHFGVGDEFVTTNVTGGPPFACFNNFCGEDSASNDYAPVSVACCDANATISKIVFADWGTVKGTCGSYVSDPTCTKNVSFVETWVANQCLGKNSCELSPYPALGDPCYDVRKRFVVQVRCSGSSGGIGDSGTSPSAVVALGIKANGRGQRGDRTKKLLLINTRNQQQLVTLPLDATLFLVDPKSVQRGGPNGIRTDNAKAGQEYKLLPFAIAVADFGH